MALANHRGGACPSYPLNYNDLRGYRSIPATTRNVVGQTCMTLIFDVYPDDICNSSKQQQCRGDVLETLAYRAYTVQQDTTFHSPREPWVLMFDGGWTSQLGAKPVPHISQVELQPCPRKPFEPPTPPIPPPSPVPTPFPTIPPSPPTPTFVPTPASPLPPVPTPTPTPPPSPSPSPGPSDSLFTRCTDSGDLMGCVEILGIMVACVVGIITVTCIIFCLTTKKTDAERDRVGASTQEHSARSAR
jgi:hypothetical protein